MLRLLISVVLLIGGACGSASQTQSPSRSPATISDSRNLSIPADLSDEIVRSSAIGKELYVLDKVAAIGTDVLFAHVSNPEQTGVVGYIPLREGTDDCKLKDSYLDTFFTADNPPRIAYEVRVSRDKPPAFQAYDPPKDVGPGFALLVRARQLAIAAMPEHGQPVNPLVLPGELYGEDGILVYLLAGTKKPNVAVFGQHFRALISKDATRVMYIVPLSKTVLEVPTRVPNGAKTLGLMVTHLVTDYPLETHVFTSLLAGMPVYVGTGRGTWRVNGSEIALIDDKPPGS